MADRALFVAAVTHVPVRIVHIATLLYFLFFASCVIILPCARVRRTSSYNSMYHTYMHLHGASPKELVRSLVVFVSMCFAGVPSISIFYSCNRARSSHACTHRYSHAFQFFFFASCVSILPCARVRRTSSYSGMYHTCTHVPSWSPKELHLICPCAASFF